MQALAHVHTIQDDVFMLHRLSERQTSIGALLGASDMRPDDVHVFLIFFVAAFLLLYLIPTIIAFIRGHDYRWVILALNVLGGWTIVMWGVAFVWSVFPRGRMLADPIVGSATGFRDRNFGDLQGEAEFGRQRGYQALQAPVASVVAPANSGTSHATLDLLERLQRLRDSGTITPEEFEAQKRSILGPQLRL